MRTHTESNGCSILVVSPFQEDSEVVTRCFADSAWVVRSEPTIPRAALRLRESTFHGVLCETDLSSGTWKEILAETHRLSRPPFLIVVSRLADEHLWAEALNLGAYDVLSKPLVDAEVSRVLHMAWLHYKYHHEDGRPAPFIRQATA